MGIFVGTPFEIGVAERLKHSTASRLAAMRFGEYILGNGDHWGVFLKSQWWTQWIHEQAVDPLKEAHQHKIDELWQMIHQLQQER